MSSLTRLLLIPAAFSLWSSVAVAKDIPGLPKELIGTFARSAEDCRDYFASLKSARPLHELATVFRKQDGGYAYCHSDGGCYHDIRGYRRIKNGYVVKVLWFGNPYQIDELSVTKLGGSKLQLRFLPDSWPWVVMRCSKPGAPSGSEH